jgi:hypothetical protein
MGSFWCHARWHLAVRPARSDASVARQPFVYRQSDGANRNLRGGHCPYSVLSVGFLVLANLVLGVANIIGPRAFLNFVTGRYHSPVEENRFVRGKSDPAMLMILVRPIARDEAGTRGTDLGTRWMIQAQRPSRVHFRR